MNNPVNMWDPTGHIPEWVGDNYYIEPMPDNMHIDYYYVLMDNYSSSSGWSLINKITNSTEIIYKYQSTITNIWEYIYYDYSYTTSEDPETGETVYEFSSLFEDIVTYSTTDYYYKDVVQKASEIAQQNEQYIKNLAGDPPKSSDPPMMSISNNKMTSYTASGVPGDYNGNGIPDQYEQYMHGAGSSTNQRTGYQPAGGHDPDDPRFADKGTNNRNFTNLFNMPSDSLSLQIRHIIDDEFKEAVDKNFREEYGKDWRLEGQKYIFTGQFLGGNDTGHPYDNKNKIAYLQGKSEAVVAAVGTAIYAGVGIYAAVPAIVGSVSSTSTIAGGSAIVSASPKIAEQAQKVLNQPVLRNALTGRFMSNTVYQMNKLTSNVIGTTKDITQEAISTTEKIRWAEEFLKTDRGGGVIDVGATALKAGFEKLQGTTAGQKAGEIITKWLWNIGK